jgi:hypothetical protein
MVACEDGLVELPVLAEYRVLLGPNLLLLLLLPGRAQLLQPLCVLLQLGGHRLQLLLPRLCRCVAAHCRCSGFCQRRLQILQSGWRGSHPGAK